MKIHNVKQGENSWHQLRAKCRTASEAPAMMGASKYTSRTELLTQKKTGLVPEVDGHKQALFDRGHATEAEARSIAEALIDDDLYPVTCTDDAEYLLASLDGRTMDGKILFEHKLMSESLAAQVRAKDLDPHYYWQLEQQLLVTGAEKVIFVCSDGTEENYISMEYRAVPGRAEALLAGWSQFDKDLEAYVPSAPAAPVVAAAVTALPSISVQVSGSIAVKDNLAAFEVALRDFVEHRLIRDPKTDQNFADLDLQIKAMKGAEAALEAIEVQLFSQVEAIDLAKRTKDMLHKLTRDNRLAAEKLLAARKDAIRLEIVQEGAAAFADHIKGLNERLGTVSLPQVIADFQNVIKGKRTVESLRGAVADELARAKIAANAIADRIAINLRTLEAGSEHSALFADRAALVLKAPDDLAAVISSRIAAHLAAEAAKAEAMREKIRAEEQAKAQREADARAAETVRAAAEKMAQDRADREAAEAAAAAEIRRQEQAREFEAQEAREIARLAAANSQMVHHVVIEPEAAAPTANVIPMTRPAAPTAGATPTLKLGQISERLGVGITAAFLRDLGFEIALKDRASCLYFEHDFGAMCAAMVRHIEGVQAKQAA